MKKSLLNAATRFSTYLSIRSFLRTIPLFILLIGLSPQALAQPVVTVRFANPEYDCDIAKYCLDVEFQSDTPGQQLDGINVRFWYDTDDLSFSNFADFQGGYQAVDPNPPMISSFIGLLFDFTGDSERVNGGVQLVDVGQPPILLSTTGWTKIFEVCFDVQTSSLDDPSFCPSVVWDIKEAPSEEGFLGAGLTYNLVGGGTLTKVAEPFNWDYNMAGGASPPPFGTPVESVCTSTECSTTDPLITASFANPVYDCDNGEYCVDVELQTTSDNFDLFGMNIRFFYDAADLDFLRFQNFEPGYTPDPNPQEITSTLDWFGFAGASTWVNGSMQVDDPADAFSINNEPTKVFEICFDVIAPPTSNFCPSLVWDLREDPSQGGYITGFNGLVVTAVNPDGQNNAIPVIENVIQFNWDYDSSLGNPPYGAPEQTNCISTLCNVADPVVTAQLSNPVFDCTTGEYCLDVELQSDLPNQELFGINVRFFYDEDILTFLRFSNFEPGYQEISTPQIVTNPINWFSFTGPTTWVNAAIQVDNPASASVISDNSFTKFFEICFEVDNPVNDPDFCPSVVWDLQEDPSQGGYVTGFNGLVISLVNQVTGVGAIPATENVNQFNWAYDISLGDPPYGAPVETTCIQIAPDIDIVNPGPQTACASYTLPAITGTNLSGNEAYYDDSQANGGQVITGPITSTTTVWIYDETGPTTNCSDETSFVVTIFDSPQLDTPADVTACDSYTLPSITGTNLTGNEAYYDNSQANGGQVITGPITSTQTVWIYDETGTTPNCSDETSFVVTILSAPQLDTPADVTACASYTFTIDHRNQPDGQ
jgi:hypothetical protein